MISKYIFPIMLLIVMWLVYFMTLLDSSGLIVYYLSLRPQMFSQIYGIITCNLLHQDYAHIYNNSTALLILSIIFYNLPIKSKNFLYLSMLIIPTGIFFIMPYCQVMMIGVSSMVFALLGYVMFYGLFKMDKDVNNSAFIIVVLFIFYLTAIFSVVTPMHHFSFTTLCHKIGFYYGCSLFTLNMFLDELQKYQQAYSNNKELE